MLAPPTHWSTFILHGRPHEPPVSVVAPNWVAALALGMAELGCVLSTPGVVFATVRDGRIVVDDPGNAERFELIELGGTTCANEPYVPAPRALESDIPS